jgi:uncharacterized protein (PEP-CTERM system associated)
VSPLEPRAIGTGPRRAPAYAGWCGAPGRWRQHAPRLTLAAVLGTSALPAVAADWNYGATATGQLTLTDNVALAPRGQEESDLVLSVVPVLSADRRGARASLRVNYAPTLLMYLNNNESNEARNYLDALFSLEAVEDFFFVDASASIRQTFISPFDPLVSGSVINENLAETATLGLSPYVRGVLGDGYTYLVRNDNFWSTSEVSEVDNLYESQVLATIASPLIRRLRWNGHYEYRYTKFESQPALSLQLLRLTGIYSVNPDLSVNARVGYEVNDYAIDDYSGPIYGGGLDWTPTPRTVLSAYVEERFFGTAYGVDLRHRRRFASATLHASRNTQTYREQALYLPAGDARQLADIAFRSRIVDPLERQRAVDEFLARSGLPPVLTSPYTFYTNRIYVTSLVEAGAGLFGARNSVSLTVFWRDNEPVTAGGTVLPDTFNVVNRFRQSGGIVAVSHSLSARTVVTASVRRTYTFSDSFTGSSDNEIESTEDILRVTVTHRLSDDTLVAAGARWVDFDSELPLDSFVERAVFAAINHRF